MVLVPSATFDEVRERPRWLVPMLVIMAATLITSYFMMPLYSEMQRAAMMARDMSAEQREQALKGMEMFKWIGLAIGPIMVGIFSALFGLFFWGWAAITGAREPQYKVAFTAMVYTGVIQILQAIAQAIVVAVKGAEQVAREGGPPTFGLALFLERGDMPGLLWDFLSNINFFSIWGTIVLAIAGIHALRMSKGTAYGFAIVMWLIMGLFLSFGGPPSS
ncbi:MAG TPA: YIP1 family protein [Gemmatimonadota bacterium]|nr:YIP1 family protein [Gemmatimonadota bacterium]